jgi:AraC family transcriptional activator of pyochelin receptor
MAGRPTRTAGGTRSRSSAPTWRCTHNRVLDVATSFALREQLVPPADYGDGRVAALDRYHRAPTTVPAAKQRIILGDGLFCFIGHGPVLGAPRREPVILLAFDQCGDAATVSIDGFAIDSGTLNAELALVVTLAECRRAFGFRPVVGRWHLSRELRVITAAITGSARADAARALFLRGKGLELACETLEALRSGSLTPYAGSEALSEADTRRIMMASRMVEERLSEPLTLDWIGRACGVNRGKLSQGFRILFGKTVATFINDARMRCARELLLTTDLSIGMVGFRSGYRNNASFARAFIRHFGMSPTDMRATAGR